jgi:hypothetical protein
VQRDWRKRRTERRIRIRGKEYEEEKEEGRM